VVREHDIVEALVEGRCLEVLKASDIMAHSAITLDVGADVSEALSIFEEKHIVRVSITAGNKLVGILSRMDALPGFLEEPEFLMF